ncbi:MAG TPA: ferrous iron transport protein A [Treponemataceae bacterium]|nr:ferrous iron transport protein A [Treponemataceae bacterium]
MTICDMKSGQSGRVMKIDTEGALRNRIFDMGVTPGVSVTLIKTAPLGDPVEISLRGYSLSLRKSEASVITVE